MKKVNAICNKIFDIFEIFLPIVTFIILFISFVILIAYRYIFHASVVWLFELNIIAFVWCSIFAASYGSRTGEHVSFTIIYDKLSEKAKLILRLISNLLVFIIFFILLPNAYNAISFLQVRKSMIIHIPFNIICAPFIIYIILTLIHHAVLFVKDIKLSIILLKGKVKV